MSHSYLNSLSIWFILLVEPLPRNGDNCLVPLWIDSTTRAPHFTMNTSPVLRQKGWTDEAVYTPTVHSWLTKLLLCCSFDSSIGTERCCQGLQCWCWPCELHTQVAYYSFWSISCYTCWGLENICIITAAIWKISITCLCSYLYL